MRWFGTFKNRADSPERTTCSRRRRRYQRSNPLVVTEATQVVGVVVLEDVLKPAISERLERLI